jgi:hypothetical protein
MEKRRAPRLRTFKGGSISFGSAWDVDCIIRNMSKTGACLEVQAHVPDRFSLLIKPELIKRTCEVAWRSAGRIGVRFK